MPNQIPAHPAAGRTPPRPATPFSWLPIRSLGERHRPRILSHLHALDARDRHLRFGYAAGDAHIGRYVDQIDFEHDEVFGVFNRRLELVAVAHLAYLGRDLDRPTAVEFGVSVVPRLRGRGIGARLFERACLHARNRSVDTLLVHALHENRAMLTIARKAGAVLDCDGVDATARLRLPPDDLTSQLTELVQAQAGELDYGIKAQADRIERLLQAMRGCAPGR